MWNQQMPLFKSNSNGSYLWHFLLDDLYTTKCWTSQVEVSGLFWIISTLTRRMHHAVVERLLLQFWLSPPHMPSITHTAASNLRWPFKQIRLVYNGPVILWFFSPQVSVHWSQLQLVQHSPALRTVPVRPCQPAGPAMPCWVPAQQHITLWNAK